MILETINASDFDIQTFLIGSAAEYGNIDGPVNEDERLEPHVWVIKEDNLKSVNFIEEIQNEN